jgi:hypothetical protein
MSSKFLDNSDNDDNEKANSTNERHHGNGGERDGRLPQQLLRPLM